MSTLRLDSRLISLREEAKQVRDPTCCDEVLALLLKIARKSTHILEIGAAEGLTSIAMHLATGARITAIEADGARAECMRRNLKEFGIEGAVCLHEGDAGEILPMLEGVFDLIFLDGPKAQYKRYFPECKRLLKRGGYLVSDDILLYGWVRGEPPKKRRMLVEHIREYLTMIESDPDLETQIYEYGEGVAVSHRK
ncbi:MAG: class I SAM-dependent methyltransferase [Clostridia bacterium]|nr:class I SAM-dependent methyltransferase [Clostridia bacterium]